MNVDRPGRRIRFPWEARFDVAEHQQKDIESGTLLTRRVPLVHHLPVDMKNHIVAMLSEFVGTFLFLLFAFGGTNAVSTAPDSDQGTLGANPAKLLYISLCFGFSLAVNAWVFFRISGGLFNPAVTLAMMLVGAIPYSRGALVIVSQLGGGIAAAAAVQGLLGPLSVQTTVAAGTTVVQGLFIEMFLTSMLVFTIFMLAAEKHKATFIAPVGIGLALFICEMLGVHYTGGSVNPARSFGPAVVLGSFHADHWIYWVGPTLGSLLATGFYLLVKAFEYETVNPDQDTDGQTHLIFDPSTGQERKVVSMSRYDLSNFAHSSSEDLHTPPESPTKSIIEKTIEVYDVYKESGNLESGNLESGNLESGNLETGNLETSIRATGRRNSTGSI